MIRPCVESRVQEEIAMSRMMTMSWKITLGKITPEHAVITAHQMPMLALQYLKSDILWSEKVLGVVWDMGGTGKR